MNRIVCPKCRANNMPGQTNCFQCGSSLPPPEAFAQPTPQSSGYAQAPPFQPAFSAPPRQTTRTRPFLAVIGIVAVVVLVMGGALLFAARKPRAPRTAAQMSAEMQAAELDQLRKAHGLGSNASQSDGRDDETRRELDRLREKYGINTGNPHNPNDGSVPNGGAMTFDQWRRQNRDASTYQFH